MKDLFNIRKILNLAVNVQVKGNLQKAEDLYSGILDKEPENINALHLLGVVKYQQNNFEKAVEFIKKAIELNPNIALFYGNLGMVYDKLGNEEESIESFEKAIEIDPDYPNSYMAYYNLGISFMNKREFEKSWKYFNKAIELNKDFFDAYWNRGLVLLNLGELEKGFEDFEYRFKKKSPTDSRVFNKPKWDCDSLIGKRILVLSEQGFGDNIQFIRYIPLLKEKGAYVLFECKKELRKLFENIGVDEFVEKEDVVGLEFDYYIHLMSLPRVFNTNLENIPNNVPYLKTDKELAEKFKKEINCDDFKVGVVWQGNPEQENNENRSTDFEYFRKIKEISGIKLFSLQKGINFEKLDNFGVVDLSDKINDFADTAAIIENMDLIISVDTAVAHLAGAMNKPCWTLLCFNSDWRWLLDRKDSPWYPNMKLFRQKTAGDWSRVFEEVVRELRMLGEDFFEVLMFNADKFK